jgi:hypothetical protein
VTLGQSGREVDIKMQSYGKILRDDCVVNGELLKDTHEEKMILKSCSNAKPLSKQTSHCYEIKTEIHNQENYHIRFF